MSVTLTPSADSAPRRLLPALFIGVFMSALDTAVIGPVIPALRETFGVDNRQVGLVMSVFILLSLCSTAVTAALSDRYGRRPVYRFSVACFALGSLLIALSGSFWMIVASRGLQGIGAGGITPTASAVVGDSFAPAERGKALGLIGATYGMAFVLGPPLAGLFMLALNWRWIFLVNLPIAALVLVLGQRLPSAGRRRLAQAFDFRGTAVIFAMLTCFVLGITHGADAALHAAVWPWFLGGGLVLLALLIAVEKRAAQPMIPLLLFGNRTLATVYCLAVGGGFGMGSIIFLTSIATLAHGVTVQHVGFVLLPLVVCSMLGSAVSGRLLNRIGARGLLLAGFGLLAAGYAGSAVTVYGLGFFLAASVPIGLGLGVVVGGSLRSLAIDEAPPELRATAQGLINIFNAVGTLTAAATIGAIADFNGGGAAGFGEAYVLVAVIMAAMVIVTLRLGKDRLFKSNHGAGSHGEQLV